MSPITERQKSILEKIVQEYINSAQPVSSGELGKKHASSFGIRPAMLRIEMEKLADGGYLLQPFVSSGRVPTDKAYRFFVDRILEKDVPKFRGIEAVEALLEKQNDDLFKFALEIVRFLAHSSSSVAFFGLPDKKILLKEGWEGMVKEPEFLERDFFADFADFVSDFENSFDDFEVGNNIRVSIGQENPRPKAKNLSLISCVCPLPNGQKGSLTIAGPKRMAYKKNISLINSLTKLMAEF
jgi:transcriptional regulator of heat shock response